MLQKLIREDRKSKVSQFVVIWAGPRGEIWEAIYVRDEIVIDKGGIDAESGGRTGVELADTGPDGKPLPTKIYGGLPPALADVEKGDRVITVGVGRQIGVPNWGKKLGDEMVLYAKKIEPVTK